MLFGGPKVYGGRMPIDAHEHMYITEEIFEVRHELLLQSLKEAGIEEPEIEAWLAFDNAFKKVIVKQSPEQCNKRYTTDEILNFPKPFFKAG